MVDDGSGRLTVLALETNSGPARARNTAIRASNQFQRLLALGLTATLFFYLAINMMMVMGLAPVVGIPLPLISWGGSAMMTVMILLGMVMGIARASRAASG